MFDAKRVTNEIIDFIRDYYKKNNLKGAVIGISGGKDSATVLAMASKAIGSQNVLAVSMPCNSRNSDFEDADLVAKTFRVKNIKVDLSKSYEEMEKEILQNIFDNFKEQTLIYVTHKNVSDKFEKIINIGDFNDRNV